MKKEITTEVSETEEDLHSAEVHTWTVWQEEAKQTDDKSGVAKEEENVSNVLEASLTENLASKKVHATSGNVQMVRNVIGNSMGDARPTSHMPKPVSIKSPQKSNTSKKFLTIKCEKCQQ